MVVQAVCSHQRQNENWHIEPACIIRTIQRIECTVQNRDTGADAADHCDAFCPVTVTLFEERQNPCHGEHGQIAADGCPFGIIGGEQVRASRYIRDHEQAQQNAPDPGAVVVGDHVHAEQMLRDPAVCQDRQGSRQQDHTGDHDTDYRLQQHQEELPQGCMKVLGETAHNEVQYQKDHLSSEEKVVDDGEECD